MVTWARAAAAAPRWSAAAEGARQRRPLLLLLLSRRKGSWWTAGQLGDATTAQEQASEHSSLYVKSVAAVVTWRLINSTSAGVVLGHTIWTEKCPLNFSRPFVVVVAEFCFCSH